MDVLEPLRLRLLLRSRILSLAACSRYCDGVRSWWLLSAIGSFGAESSEEDRTYLFCGWDERFEGGVECLL
jgi:hypothetical protein